MTAPAADPARLFARLDILGISHTTVEHRPIFTVEEGRDLKAALPGLHTKNLFLKDKKGGLWLVCAEADARVDLNALARHLGAPRFSFGSAALLLATLGVTPGSVTAFALINDPEARVRLVLDARLTRDGPVNFHPLTNAATTAIAPADLMRFIADTGRSATIVDLDTLGAEDQQA